MGLFGTPDYAVNRNGVGSNSGPGKTIVGGEADGGNVQDGGTHGGAVTK